MAKNQTPEAKKEITESIKAQNAAITKKIKEWYEQHMQTVHIKLENAETGAAVINDGFVLIPFKNGMPKTDEQTKEPIVIVIGAVDGDFIEDVVPFAEKQAKLQRKQQKYAAMQNQAQQQNPNLKLVKKDEETK